MTSSSGEEGEVLGERVEEVVVVEEEHAPVVLGVSGELMVR
jgi:hypothetical protein